MSEIDASVLELLRDRIRNVNPVRRIGYVSEIVVSTVKAYLPDVMQGELCEIQASGGRIVLGEVIAFKENLVTISCLQSVVGIALGAKVVPKGKPHSIKASNHLLSAVLDGVGRNLDDPENTLLSAISSDMDAVPVIRPAPPASRRPPVSKPFYTQIKVLDGLMTLGIGQRVGIFASPGCGKSTLMAQIVRGCSADVVVFGLVGERGRELREFMENEMTPDIRAKSFFVCATSDRSPIERVRAAFTATSLAEHQRDQGKNVLLVVDSLTRLARAQRELGLMAGEPATQSGFTPSVYSVLPELIERSGQTEQGSITAVYTVLMEGERLEDDPIASEAKSLLDGHIVLTHKLVEKAHFPAIDPLKSLSRVMNNVVSSATIEMAALLRRAYSMYQEVELLIRLNEYQAGTDPLLDEAVRIKPDLDLWCKQSRLKLHDPAIAQRELHGILENFKNLTVQSKS